MREMTATEFFDYFDFSIYKSINCDGDICYKLKDNQYANLGDIESDEFVSIEWAVNRLDMYYNDYIIRDLEDLRPEIELRGNYENIYNTIKDIEDNYLEYHKTLLYYILNPNKIIDNVEFERY